MDAASVEDLVFHDHRPVGWGHLTKAEWLAVFPPAFEELRPLFEREAELLEIDREPENTEWAEIWEELKAPGLFVESADGRQRFDILWIHFRNGRAWWWPLYNSPETVLRRV